MKPAPFDYVRPDDLDEALTLLAEDADDAKLLAGGQSLIPLLNFRLARPTRLIDVGRLGSLAYIRRTDGALHIGATTKQAQLERSRLVAEHWPLLAEAVPEIAHFQIRNMGTVGGSVAHADPAAELPVVLTALDAVMHVRSVRGRRAIPAADFFVTHLTNAMQSDEMLVEIEVPPYAASTGSAFVEYTRRHGDFALGGCAALVSLDAAGNCGGARIVLMSVAPTPWRATDAEDVLKGGPLTAETIAAAADVATATLEPTGDIHGPPDFRRSVAFEMARRALETAATRAVVA